jgi:hypothetical protein
MLAGERPGLNLLIRLIQRFKRNCWPAGKPAAHTFRVGFENQGWHTTFGQMQRGGEAR